MTRALAVQLNTGVHSRRNVIPGREPVLEAIATLLLRDAGVGAPVDSMLLARALGLHVVARADWTPAGAPLSSIGIIAYNPTKNPLRQQWQVAQQIARHVLLQRNELITDAWVDGLARALMLPAYTLREDLNGGDWRLSTLRRLHPNVGRETILRRIPDIVEAVISFWDATGHEMLERAYSFWLPESFDRDTVFESQLAVNGGLEPRGYVSNYRCYAVPLKPPRKSAKAAVASAGHTRGLRSVSEETDHMVAPSGFYGTRTRPPKRAIGVLCEASILAFQR